MNLNKFHTVLQETPEEVREYVRLSMDILERIHELLDKKFDGKQKLLADKLGISEVQVSKWLNGVQNFTLKTLSKLEVAFGEPIVAVCTGKDDDSIFIQAKAPYRICQRRFIVNGAGKLEESDSDYKILKGALTQKGNAGLLKPGS